MVSQRYLPRNVSVNLRWFRNATVEIGVVALALNITPSIGIEKTEKVELKKTEIYGLDYVC